MKIKLSYVFIGLILFIYACNTKRRVVFENDKKIIYHFKNKNIQKIEEYTLCNQLVKELKYLYITCFNCRTGVLYYKQGYVVYDYEIVTIEINYYPNKYRHTMIIEYNSKPLCMFYEWDEEGNLICEGQLLNLSKFQHDRKYEIIAGGIILVEVNSGYQREGRWLYYNNCGEVIRSELYSKGVLLSFKDYVKYSQ